MLVVIALGSLMLLHMCDYHFRVCRGKSDSMPYIVVVAITIAWAIAHELAIRSI